MYASAFAGSFAADPTAAVTTAALDTRARDTYKDEDECVVFMFSVQTVRVVGSSVD